MSDEKVTAYHVWDAPTRWFHWINVATVFTLLLSGLFFKYRELFFIESLPAKMALMTAHVCVGYVFAANLLVRIVWGFFGNRFARWRAVLPDLKSLRAIPRDIRSLLRCRPYEYLGRCPLSRFSAAVMFALLTAEAGTGLVRAATDLYYPPFGGIVAAYIAPPGADVAAFTWKDKGVEDRVNHLKRFKRPFGSVHLYGAYALLVLIFLHIAGVTLSEVRQRSGIVSSMFSGRKVLTVMPMDSEDANQ